MPQLRARVAAGGASGSGSGRERRVRQAQEAWVGVVAEEEGQGTSALRGA